MRDTNDFRRLFYIQTHQKRDLFTFKHILFTFKHTKYLHPTT